MSEEYIRKLSTKTLIQTIFEHKRMKLSLVWLRCAMRLGMKKWVEDK